MSEQPASRAGEPPDIYGELLHEVTAYFATLRVVLARPAAFHRAWVRGEARALNPFFFYFSGSAVLFASDLIKRRLLGQPPWYIGLLGKDLDATFAVWSQSVVFDLVGANVLVIQNVAIASLLWLLVRTPGQKGSFTATLAATLYSSGALAPFAVGLDAVQVAHHALTGGLVSDTVLGALTLPVQATYLVAALVGALGVRPWRAIKAMLLSFFVLSALAAVILAATGQLSKRARAAKAEKAAQGATKP